ncbi:MAG: LacI family DNA-binding transcriptional regulator [Candidatus Gallimonas sp.]
MNDIAREANVSVATVSRFINNEMCVSGEKAERIKAAIDKFHFVPNRYARGLKTNRAMQIMLIVPDIKNPYYAKLYDVLQSIANREKYIVILYNTNEDEENELKAIELASELNCDGIVFCSVSDRREIIEKLQSVGKPVVSSSSFKCRVFDTVHGVKPGQGVYLGTRCLIDHGHRKIGFAGGNSKSILNVRRFSGYKRAIAECGIELVRERVFCNSFTLEGGYLAGEYFAWLSERPTAVVCANDMIAIGMMQYFNKVGIDIPGDISIVGMDNIAMSELVKPALTTVTNDSGEFAVKAAQLLFDRILHGYEGEAREAFCERKLIERDSVRRIF